MTNSALVNAPNLLDNGNPSVAALGGGRAAIAYQSRQPDGSFDPVLRLREADGTLGAEYRPDGDFDLVRDVEVAQLSDGALLLTWLAETSSPGGARTNIVGQRVSEAGIALSPAIALDTRRAEIAAGRYRDNAIEVDPNGGFRVSAVANGGETIFYTDFETDDVLVRGGNASFRSPVATYGPLGNSASATSYYSAEYRIDISLDTWELTRLADGDVIGTVLEYRPPDFTSPSYSPLHVSFTSDRDAEFISVIEDRETPGIRTFAVEATPDGGFVVTWTVDGGVFAQLFDESGGYRGDNFEVASTSIANPRPVVAAISEDEILFAWQDKTTDDLDVISRAVSVETLSEGVFVWREPPFLRAQGEVRGEALEGETLRLQGSIDSNYAIERTSIQWYRVEDGGPREAIEGATGLRFTPGAEEVGKRISVTATIENAAGQTLTRSVSLLNEDNPNGRSPTIENVPDAAEGAIPIAGLPYAGRTLTARPEITDADGIPSGAFRYQWVRGEDEIEGAFSPRYRSTQEDLGREITVRISFFDANGSLERVTSDPVRIVVGPTEGDDVLIGGAGNGRITGLGGDDRLDGGAGNDLLTGGEGADIFVFARGRGEDRIADFTPGDDRVEFDFEDIGRVKDLVRDAGVRQVGEDVVIDFGGGDILTLLGLDRGELSASDAIFA